MRRIPTKIASIAAAAAILVTPAMAAASTVQASAPAPNAWVTFSQLNPAGATALAGSSAAAQPGVALTGSAAAVQGADDGYNNGIPLPVIAVWLAVIGAAVYIALIEKHHHHGVFLTSPD